MASGTRRARKRSRKIRRAFIQGIVPIVFYGLPLVQALLNNDQTQLKHSYITSIGEHTRIELPDGSTIDMDARSAVTVSYSSHVRLVHLDFGQALFTVRPDSERPFYVSSGNALLRDRATQFNVNRKMHSTDIVVIEGRVQVQYTSGILASESTGAVVQLAPQEMHGGQELNLPDLLAAEPIPPRMLSTDEMKRAISWTEGQLLLNADFLTDAVEEMNRHNAVQFVIADPAISNLHLSARFGVNGVDDFISVLAHQCVQAIPDTSGSGVRTIVLSRSPASRHNRCVMN